MNRQKKANELYLYRVYDAPLEMVWDAWTQPEQAAHWWGPRGFTITNKSKDFRTGGSWVYTMHGPDGVDYPNHARYLEVEAPRKMAYDHGGNEHQAPLFRVTVEFTALGNHTALDFTMAFASAEIAAKSAVFIKKAGGEATWDRLAEYLAQKQEGKEVFVINRSFAGSVDRLYRLWTEPKHLAKWLAPNGSLEFMRDTIQEGASTFSVMRHGPGSPPMYGRASYIELRKPNRIVYTQQFCDADEGVVRHPMAATWPLTLLTTVTLASEEAEQTRLTIRWEPFGEVSPIELQTFANARRGMAIGWTASLDGLENYLASTG